MLVPMLLSFVVASVVFGLIPGPSVCFTVAHALKYGTRKTLPTILGQLAANCCQVLVVLFGLSKLLEQSVVFFHGLKMIGTLYLVYLGIRQWTAAKPVLNTEQGANGLTMRRAFVNGFVVCGTNPKAIFFYAALLPQFILPHYDANTQLVILAITNVIVAASVLLFYTMIADRVRRWFGVGRFWKTQNRLSGTIMIGAGVAMSVMSRK
ncbi:MAG: LysE family translocator [candidate division WOR-3 bacterium]|nr:MAG: LysE family translocator [candidate division WOR-3 bacterium]